ncbi:deoxyribose-phosphate aldolase [Fulvivirga sedimenti]|uniref:Deoxyribose-phosphate aldolase n=1 Tax=Fulvivirga sedimenti TaxID=2879465 RepID=A0A9X1HM09_9BACT|nr:deoxyribose-phosphate aldolase [Fulvivirga sedimenti]MCA6074445.1 deoxyribose-phosphate aldolase [Fulvivirga sedimenti]
MDIASRIEHTALSPVVTPGDLDSLLQEAVEHSFHGICIPPFWVKRMAREAGGTGVAVVTVAGFPLGYQMTQTKIKEIETALEDGADEIDLVWNISAFKDGMTWPKIEIAKSSKLIHEAGKILKVIIETCYLSDEEIMKACHICADAGVDFVKTSTGFGSEGAVVRQVAMMRQMLPSHVGIKASGGIKSYEQAVAFVEAGADRLGTSSGIKIIQGETLGN